MNFFNDDPFESIINEFFNRDSRRNEEKIIHGEEEDRIIDFLETKNKVYIVFELPGYNEKDIDIVIKNKTIEIKAKKRTEEKIQDYLNQKLYQGITIKKTLPKFINSKKFSYTLKNGVLEIIFNKK